jgi:hypothetical protein
VEVKTVQFAELNLTIIVTDKPIMLLETIIKIITEAYSVLDWEDGCQTYQSG